MVRSVHTNRRRVLCRWLIVRSTTQRWRPNPQTVDGPAAGDLVGDPPGPPQPPVGVVVIATVGDESLGALAWPGGWGV